MTTSEASGAAVEVTVLTEANESFLTDKLRSDLNPLLLALKRASKEAVATLVKVMEDDKADLKTKVAAAKAILEMQVDVASKLNQDSIARLVAEIKLNRGIQNTTQLTEDTSGPIVNFSDIRQVE